MNDVANWPSLFSEFSSTEILDQSDSKVTYRLTLQPDEQGRMLSWVSERTVDPVSHTVYTRRVDKDPYEFMNIFWYFQQLGPERTRMCWIQDFAMQPTASLDDAGMTERLVNNAKIQMDVIKQRLESARLRVRSSEEVAFDARRGGDVRVLLSPADVGCTSGTAGLVRLAPGDAVAEHSYPYSEKFLLVSSGELTVDLDGAARKVGCGAGLFIPRQVRHRLRNTAAEEAVAAFFLSPVPPLAESES